MITLSEAKKMTVAEIKEELVFAELCHKEIRNIETAKTVSNLRLALVVKGEITIEQHMLNNMRRLSQDSDVPDENGDTLLSLFEELMSK